jgi:hypothetical protein
VLPAIQLDHEARSDAVEIENVAGNRHLASELESTQLPIADNRPKLLLGICRLMPHESREAFEAGGLIAAAVHD